MKTFKQMRKDWMKDPEFRKEYDALEDEFHYYFYFGTLNLLKNSYIIPML